MGKLRIKKAKEKKLIWIKFRHYIDFIILICCCIIAFNIHPSNVTKDKNISSDKSTMIYVFHDYKWNEYIMNDHLHWAPSSWDYLFDDEVPNDLKWQDEFTDSVSIGDLIGSQEWESFTGKIIDISGWIKDNQVSLNEIISDLWVDYKDSETNEPLDSDTLIIAIWDNEDDTGEDYYTIKEMVVSGDTSSLIIERINYYANDQANHETWSEDIETNIGTVNYETISPDNNTTESYNEENDGLLIVKSFTSIEEDRILPVLTPWNDLFFDYNNETVTYVNNFGLSWNDYSINKGSNSSGITIINTYPSCMTPWWYKIKHWDSVLAYKQLDNAPDICNIERRFCWKWKLSWTYTQQWCSVNKNYTYEKWETFNTTKSVDDEFKWWTRQNSDGSVTVKNSEIWWSFVFDRPNNIYSDFSKSDNIRTEKPWIEQTSRSYPDCTAPRWEKVKHWQFIQAFKHANWFSDAPCEAQIRLCSMWELMWTYTESTCKTRDTSFIDRVNGSPSRNTYSKEKIEWIKKQIKNEQDYYENTRKNAVRSTNSDALDRILYILDQNN